MQVAFTDYVQPAFDSGRLAGAALDVLPEQPPADPILRHPKAILSPHAAFYSLEADEELRRRSISNIVVEGNR